MSRGQAEAGDVADVAGPVGVRPGGRGQDVTARRGHGSSLGALRAGPERITPAPPGRAVRAAAGLPRGRAAGALRSGLTGALRVRGTGAEAGGPPARRRRLRAVAGRAPGPRRRSPRCAAGRPPARRPTSAAASARVIRGPPWHPSTTTVISPSVPSAAQLASSASVPRLTSSWVLVSSRQTTRPAPRPERRGQLGQGGLDPPGGLEEDQGPRLGGQLGEPAGPLAGLQAAGTPRSRTGRWAGRTRPARRSPRTARAAP